MVPDPIELLSPADFQAVVSLDVKNQLPTEHSTYLRDVCPDRWYEALSILKRETEMTLGRRKSDLYQVEVESGVDSKDYKHERARYEKWKQGTLFYLFAVEKRLVEASECKRRRVDTSSLITALEDMIDAAEIDDDTNEVVIPFSLFNAVARAVERKTEE